MVKENNKRKRVKNVEKKDYNRNNKKNKNLEIILFIFFFSFIICGIYLLLRHPKFNIYNYSVEGTSRYSVEEIAECMNIQKEKNIFLEVFTANKNCEKLSYIDKVNIRIILPSKVIFKVKERTAKYLAYDKEKNRFFRLSDDGHILEESSLNKKTDDELLMYGVTFDNNISFGQVINDIDISKIIVFNEIKDELISMNINYNITKVNFENSLTTLTLNDKLNVVFPNNDAIKYKVALLKEILNNIGEDSVGVVDLTKTNPTYSSY